MTAPVTISKNSGVNRNDSVILPIKESSVFTTFDLLLFMIHPRRCYIAGHSGYVLDNT